MTDHCNFAIETSINFKIAYGSTTKHCDKNVIIGLLYNILLILPYLYGTMTYNTMLFDK